MEFQSGKGTGKLGTLLRGKSCAWVYGRAAARADLLPVPKITRTEISFVLMMPSSSRADVTHKVTITPEALVGAEHRLYGKLWRRHCTCEHAKKNFLGKHVLESFERLGLIDIRATIQASLLDDDGDIDKRRLWLRKQARLAYRAERELIRKTLAKRAGIQKASSVIPRTPTVKEDVTAEEAKGLLDKMADRLPTAKVMELLSIMAGTVAVEAPGAPPVPEGPPVPEAPPIPEADAELLAYFGS